MLWLENVIMITSIIYLFFLFCFSLFLKSDGFSLHPFNRHI